MKRWILAASAATACSLVTGQGAMSVDWEWSRAHQCSKSSPRLQVSGIPAGTKLLRVKLVDHDATSFHHGGGDVEHAQGDSTTIPEGALKAYTGPCPPNFGSFGHDYAFTITAVGADGTPLATGSATKNFSARSVPR